MQLVLSQDEKTRLVFKDEDEFNKFVETIKQFLKLPIRPVGLEFDCGNYLEIDFTFYPEHKHKIDEEQEFGDVMSRLVNMHNEKFDAKTMIRIDRKSLFGNPFKIGKDGNREEVIAKFSSYFAQRLVNDKEFAEKVDLLVLDINKGKKLACWCFPDNCHGQCFQIMPFTVKECIKKSK